MRQVHRLLFLSVQLACGAVAACADSVSPDASVATIEITADSATLAGERALLHSVVRDAANSPLVGVRVRWTLAGTNSGALDSAETTTDGSGIARVWWTAATSAGSYLITAKAGSIISQHSLLTRATHATTMMLTPGQARVVRFLTPVPVSVTFFDEYGNAGALVQNVQLLTTAPITTQWDSVTSTIQVRSLSAVRHMGQLVVRAVTLADDEPVLATLDVVVQIGVASIAIAGVDSVDELAVGESLPLNADVRDSTGVRRTVAMADIGATITSSNPDVVVVNDTVLTAHQTGTTQLTLHFESRQFTTEIAVVPLYELGAVATLYDIPPPELYFMAYAISDTSGNSLLVKHQYGRPATASGTGTAEWHNIDGTVRWSKDYVISSGASIGALFGPGVVYLSSSTTRQTTRLDAQGSEQWTLSYSRPMTADAPTVFFGDTALWAVSPAGSLLWSYKPSSPVTWVRAGTVRVFLHTSQQLIALDRSGNVLWSRESMGMSGVIDDASRYFVLRIVLPPAQGQMTAIGSDGALLWTTTTNDAFGTTLGPNNTVLVAARDTLYGFDRSTGSQLWKVKGSFYNTAVETVGDRVLVGARRYIKVYDATNGQLLGRTKDRFNGFVSQMVCTSVGLQFVVDGTMRRYPTCR